jgi:hypothetical protein
MKDGNKVEVKLHAFLTPVPDALLSLSSWEREPSSHLIEECMCFGAGLDMVKKRNIPALREI